MQLLQALVALPTTVYLHTMYSDEAQEYFEQEVAITELPERFGGPVVKILKVLDLPFIHMKAFTTASVAWIEPIEKQLVDAGKLCEMMPNERALAEDTADLASIGFQLVSQLWSEY